MSEAQKGKLISDIILELKCSVRKLDEGDAFFSLCFKSDEELLKIARLARSRNTNRPAKRGFGDEDMTEFKTNCEAHSWPEPNDGWCPVCIMNESDDVKRQRDQLRDALATSMRYFDQVIAETGYQSEGERIAHQNARAALAATEEPTQ